MESDSASLVASSVEATRIPSETSTAIQPRLAVSDPLHSKDSGRPRGSPNSVAIARRLWRCSSVSARRLALGLPGTPRPDARRRRAVGLAPRLGFCQGLVPTPVPSRFAPLPSLRRTPRSPVFCDGLQHGRASVRDDLSGGRMSWAALSPQRRYALRAAGTTRAASQTGRRNLLPGKK
jgi:hypothetical protein